MSPEENLVYMANQIGRFFVSQGEDEAVNGTRNHILQFWDPRMRAGILAYVEAGGEGLDDNVRAAILSLKADRPGA